MDFGIFDVPIIYGLWGWVLLVVAIVIACTWEIIGGFFGFLLFILAVACSHAAWSVDVIERELGEANVAYLAGTVDSDGSYRYTNDEGQVCNGEAILDHGQQTITILPLGGCVTPG